MSNTALIKPSQPESNQVIDISANLLLTWVEDSKENALRQNSKSFKKVIGVLACAILVLGSGYLAFYESESAKSLSAKEFTLSKTLKTMGVPLKQDAAPSNDIESMRQLSEAYDASNKDLIILLGHSLVQVKGQIVLKTARIESAATGIKASGTASVINVKTMRFYLDAVQSAVPGSEGLMTSINSASSEQERGLQVAFEISKLGIYNFVPKPKSEILSGSGSGMNDQKQGPQSGDPGTMAPPK